MEKRRLSISMIEQMDLCCGGSYSHFNNIGGTTTMMMEEVDEEGEDRSTNTSTSDLSCQLAQSRGVATTTSGIKHRMKPPTTIYSHNDSSNRYQYHQQRDQNQHQQNMVLPHLRSQSSKASMNTSFSSNTTSSTTTMGSSSITFYQSPTKENYVVDQLYDRNNELNHHGRESKQLQRGVDRSITLPRETHLNVSTNTPVAIGSNHNCHQEHLIQPSTPVLSTISPNRMNRNCIERTKSSIVSPTCLTVTPEVTRPTKNTIQRNASTSSILCMPPLYPLSPPQRQAPPLTSLLSQSSAQWRTMRSSPSPVQRRHMFHGHATQPNTMVTNESSSIVSTPQRSTNAFNVDATETRTLASMCISPPNLASSSAPTTAEVAIDTTTAVTTDTSMIVDSTVVNGGKPVPVMLDLAPGVQIHLRGADETQMAINTGFYIQCECLFCSVADASSPSSTPDEMYCILDCDYFICPTCRSVHPNPISTNSNIPTTTLLNQHGTRYPGGLGLGFRLEQ
jgi:hypothetical protein